MQENHAHLAATMKVTKGTWLVPEANRNIKKGGEISTMSQLIVPQVALISATTSITNKVASDGLVAASDQIVSLGCIICRPQSS
jgi:hypothetical protein